MRNLCVIAILFAFAIHPAGAAGLEDSTYGSPAPLIHQLGIYNTNTIEGYTDRILRMTRLYGRDKTRLDMEDVKRFNEQRRKQANRYALMNMINYDINSDGKVRAEEIRSWKTDGERRMIESTDRYKQIEASIQELLKGDTNGDGELTLEETRNKVREEMAEWSDRLNGPEAFLKLDPDSDGQLSLKELLDFAHEAFRTADTDRDGILSAEEIKTLREIEGQDARESAG